MAEANKSPGTKRRNFITKVLQGNLSRPLILTVLFVLYLLLFFGTGSVAFFSNDPQEIEIPKGFLTQMKEMGETEKGKLWAVVEEGIRKGIENDLKRNELAGQSFNVVLGAIIGFLSAAVTFMFTPEPVSSDDD
ncbi:MAG: hypothetical protein ABJG78_17660 [Cyclobacteriaceae bacterium]